MLDSPKRSSSSSAGGAGFFYYFFYCFCWGFFPLKALWAYLGRSLDPTVLSVATTDKYQAVRCGYAFLYSSPRRVEKTTDNPAAIAISAIVNDSPTRNFLPLNCPSKTFKNLWTSSETLVTSTYLPSLATTTAATAASKSQAETSSH